ncbi:MAG: pyridoxamine 5'-phosphate oxidase family protein [Actinomycetota bacterium]
MTALPDRAADVFEAGTFCAIAASGRSGPHVTPLVFAWSSGSIWVTTARGSVKARSWTRDPRVAGLVRVGDDAVAFTGRVRTYDALDTSTWLASVGDAPDLARATARFSRKNARFFAGYAVDARRVPLAWTPPGRVFARIELDGGAVVARDEVAATWGSWRGAGGSPLPSQARFRAGSRTGAGPLDGLASPIATGLGRGGRAALAFAAPRGPILLPVRWAVDERDVWSGAPVPILALAGLEASSGISAAVCIDRGSSWRARDMLGAMIVGDAAIYATDRLTSGAGSASRHLDVAGVTSSGGAVVRINPGRIVWWSGWSSGTVRP